MIDEQIGELDKEMASLLSQHQDAVERLAEVPVWSGSAQQIIAEVGPYLSDLSLRRSALLVGRCFARVTTRPQA